MAMMALLQSPQVTVLGITMVTGDQWEPEEVAHTLRMLELIHRSEVPVVPGAVFPLVRNEAESMAARAFDGSSPWYGAWTERPTYHAPFVVPTLVEGEPTTKPLNEDAAHFLIRQVHAHPHAVTIYAAGPLTNIALALAIDPEFAPLTRGIVLMGGSLAPRTDDPEFATNPRHEFNFWFICADARGTPIFTGLRGGVHEISGHPPFQRRSGAERMVAACRVSLRMPARVPSTLSLQAVQRAYATPL
jgi:inosine-uridine nucleoside N-ribohydrolase